MGKEVAVELKNDIAITGTLVSVDQYLNVKLSDVRVVDPTRYPQLVRGRSFSMFIMTVWFAMLFVLMFPPFLQVPIKSCFIRGSVVRYIQIPAKEVDTELLQDAARKENSRWIHEQLQEEK